MSEVSDVVSLSAAVAVRDWALVRDKMTAFHAARGAESEAATALEEAMLQCYLFLGFPAALQAFSIWREVAGETGSETGRDPAEDSLEEWRERGQSICRTVYQANFEKLRANVHTMHPALDRWMITEGYGKVLGRPGLSLAARELCTVAILAATGWERQLHSHLRGALNASASRQDVDDALQIGLRLSPDPDWRRRAEDLWVRVRERHNTTTG
ncbi:MAG: carboxymuconolactone decarboxylase family protein [Gemmatimonadota bacterium]